MDSWCEYRAFLLRSGWGYAHHWESLVAGRAVQMNRVKALAYIDGQTVCRDSRLRIAALMRVQNDPMITIRLGVRSLGWDVVLWLPRVNGVDVTDYVLSTAEGMTGTMSMTLLNLMLTEAELGGAMGVNFSNARRVCSWGLSLLREGVELERDIQEAFASESRKAKHLLNVRYEGETQSDIRACEEAVVDGILRVQRDFEVYMDLCKGVCLN